MLFQPTPQEVAAAQLSLSTAPSDLNEPSLLQPASEWGLPQLLALRVWPIDNLPPERLLGNDFSNLKTLTVYQELKKELLAPSEDELKEFNLHQKKYRLNPFRTLFSRVAAAMATRPAHIAGTISHARNPSTASDLSSSSQEDKPEETSKQALEALIEEILIFEDNGLMPVTGSIRYFLQLVVNSQTMPVRLGTQQAILVRNDGGVCVTRQGSFTGSDRYGIVPVLSLEAKRRSAGGIHRPSGETEEWTARPVGQEAAELLGQATAQSLELDGWKDQHALVASTHGTVVRLTTADIKESYLSHLHSPTMPISECLFVVRSQGYDLRTREGRDGALLLFIGVIEYLKSERAMIGQLQ